MSGGNKRNPYGYWLTKRELEALRWARDRRVKGAEGGFFITRPGFKRYRGMARGTPCAVVRGLLDKSMVYQERDLALMAGIKDRDGTQLEAYAFTARAVHALARNGGYHAGGRVWKERADAWS